MTQNPPDWGQQGGYPPQGPGGYPPQQPGGYPSPGGYPPQQPVGYPPQQPPPQQGYPPQSGYSPQRAYGPPSGGYPPQPADFGPQGPGGPGTQGAPAKKSPVMIIAIVAAAIVLLAAVGGIIMVLTRGGDDQPDVTIAPSQPVPPTEQPTPEPTGRPTTAGPQPTPTSQPPTGGAINLGNGIELQPAAGWEVKKTGENVAQLSDGKSVFLGQSLQISQSTNPGQLCDAWHRNIAEGTSNGQFQDSKDANVGTSSLKAATCVAQVTVSGGQGTTKLYLF